MAENTDSVQSRGSFLKKAGLVVGAAAISVKEIQQGKEGVHTSVGDFIPIYERHDFSITPDRIPDNLSGFFREGSLDKGNFESSAHHLLKTDTFQKGNLEKLAKSGTKIIFGDVSLPYDEDVAGIDTMHKLGVLGITAGFISEMVTKGTAINNWLLSRKAEPVQGRRKLLRNTLRGIAGFAAAPYVTFMAAQTSELESSVPQSNAVTRILGRLQGMNFHLHPEFTVIFFRNLIMTDKMLTVAEKMRRENNKPRTGFNVGNAHNGIEDMLVAGHDFVRTLISLYPKPFLTRVAEQAGGLENLCTARVVSLPKDFTYQDIDDPQRSKLVAEERVIDTRLLEILQSKLAV